MFLLDRNFPQQRLIHITDEGSFLVDRNFPQHRVVHITDDNTDRYEITFAVPGYSSDELHVSVETDDMYGTCRVIVEGRPYSKDETVKLTGTSSLSIIHDGISHPKFKKVIPITRNRDVVDSVTLENGLLTISINVLKNVESKQVTNFKINDSKTSERIFLTE